MSVTNARRSTTKPKATKIIVWLVGATVTLAVAGYAALEASPWPSALLVRFLFDLGGERLSQALEKHVPAGVMERLNERYDAADRDALLDVFYPSQTAGTAPPPLTIVWVHGGGWVSGSKGHIANYAKILAGRGYTVVGVDYSIAPGKTYPTPVRQVNAALAYLAKNAERLHLDASRFVLAGDSAGAQIAAQLANAISVPTYAAALGIAPAIDRTRLAGAILYCGPYDMAEADAPWLMARFRKTVLWSYSGGRDYATNPRFVTASVIKYVTKDFPPLFISVGNADPLLPQSLAFADALSARGGRVDRLFFPKDYKPALPHEYQFDLDNEAGRRALESSIAFLSILR